MKLVDNDFTAAAKTNQIFLDKLIAGRLIEVLRFYAKPQLAVAFDYLRQHGPG